MIPIKTLETLLACADKLDSRGSTREASALTAVVRLVTAKASPKWRNLKETDPMKLHNIYGELVAAGEAPTPREFYLRYPQTTPSILESTLRYVTRIHDKSDNVFQLHDVPTPKGGFTKEQDYAGWIGKDQSGTA